jgi:hypothetical protein
VRKKAVQYPAGTHQLDDAECREPRLAARRHAQIALWRS